jgi:hypothetical protein
VVGVGLEEASDVHTDEHRETHRVAALANFLRAWSRREQTAVVVGARSLAQALGHAEYLLEQY